MQTFLPFDTFQLSAEVLDRWRLGAMRREPLQLLLALLRVPELPGADRQPTHGYAKVAIGRAWAGHERALAGYGYACAAEWVRQGWRDTCGAKLGAFLGLDLERRRCEDLAASGDRVARRVVAWVQHHGPLRSCNRPPWLGDPDFHASHAALLVRKAREDVAKYAPGTLKGTDARYYLRRYLNAFGPVDETLDASWSRWAEPNERDTP